MYCRALPPLCPHEVCVDLHPCSIEVTALFKLSAVFYSNTARLFGKAQKQLWANLPEVYRTQATFYTDQYDAYTGVIPAERHKAITKDARKTNHIERFNNTLRQRVSRLVRETLAFSKTVENHIGAIRYFICHYNLARATALPV